MIRAGTRIRPLLLPYILLACALLMLAGCTTQPQHTVPLAHVEDHHTPQILVNDGTRAASPSEYRGLLRGISDDAQRRAALDALIRITQSINGTGLTAGNEARILVDGPATFAAMFEDIERAEHSIHLETFIFEYDDVGEAFARRLIESRRRGVEVRLLIDAVGSMNLPESFHRRMRDAGVEVRKFHPLDPGEDVDILRINNRNHRKSLIIDGRIAYAGGINVSDVYSRGSFSSKGQRNSREHAWRDTHVRIAGPVVHRFQRLFLDLWNKDRAAGKQLEQDALFPTLEDTGSMLAGVVAGHGGEQASAPYTVFDAVFSRARERIWITQAYFAPDDRLIEALQDAARRGVDVQLLLPGVTDAPLLVEAARSSYSEMLESGIRIYEHSDTVLHAKTLVVDGIWSSIGSTNFDYRSLVHNYELNAVIISEAFGSAMETLFHADLESARQINLDEWRKRPLLQRFKESVGDALRQWL